MKIRVDINLREGVLDPQGKAVAHALGGLGFEGVGEVRIGKTVEIEIAESDPKKAADRAKSMAEKLLANTVIEDYQVSVVSS